VATDKMQIGVLALQGGVREHAEMLAATNADVEVREVRLPADLAGLAGIVLPGGESTTMRKLLAESGLLEPLRSRIADGLPAYGTCAGMILLARTIEGAAEPVIGALDITVRRNAFGSQRDSFEEELSIAGMQGGPLHGIFIRAPSIEGTGPAVEVQARLKDGRPAAVRQGSLLASAFHPELGRDPRFHALFVDMCVAARDA
jgi:pyridoxal 5'-phosphate synthase pdxT subunit